MVEYPHMQLFRAVDKKIIQCLACAHYCKIAEGQTGLCGVRLNEKQKINLLVYGRPFGTQIDPIEKKPLYHFLPGTDILSLGTFGCNFRCDFCQNWDISQLTRKGGGVKNDWKKLLETFEYLSPQKLADIAIKNNCPSIGYTYNEPTIWAEYAVDIAEAARARGIKNVFVSNGYLSEECFKFVSPHLDAINIDLKSFSEEFYHKTCGGDLQSVLENIVRFYDKGVWMELTTLVIPRLNDSEKELKKIADFIASIDTAIPWHISSFHSAYKMIDREFTPPLSLKRAYQIGKDAGLKHIYIGNVKADIYGDTYCPECGELLIERGDMSLKKNNLKTGQCPRCKTKIAGIFE